MNKRINDRKVRGSLRRQIRSAARQLADDRQAIRLHRVALGERLQAALTSPGMLLLAGSAGFVIADVTGRADSAQDSKDPGGSSRRPSMSGARRALRLALEMYSFAHAATTAIGAEPHPLPDRTPLLSA